MAQKRGSCQGGEDGDGGGGGGDDEMRMARVEVETTMAPEGRVGIK